MTKGTLVRITTTGEETRIDAVAEDSRGTLYRVETDRWFDARYLDRRG